MKCFASYNEYKLLKIQRIVAPPPLGKKIDLEVRQRSPSRSRHGTIGKVLSQRTHMPSIKALPVIVQKLWPRLKFLWRTDRWTDRRTDEWDLMSPRFRESGGQKEGMCPHVKKFSLNLNVSGQNKCSGTVSRKISLFCKMQRERSLSFELFQLDMYEIDIYWINQCQLQSSRITERSLIFHFESSIIQSIHLQRPLIE